MKLFKNPAILLILAALILPQLVNAQSNSEVENDFNTWISGSISKEIIKNLDFSISPEIRLKDNFEWNKFQSDFQLSYKPIKHIETSLGYRLVMNTTSKGHVLQNRFFADISAEKKFDRIKTELKLKYTNDSEFKASDTPESCLRYKAAFSYNLRKSKFTPNISTEAFHNLNNQQIELMRYQIGSSYKLNKHSSIKLGYSLDYFLHEYKNAHIVKLEYYYKF